MPAATADISFEFSSKQAKRAIGEVFRIVNFQNSMTQTFQYKSL